MKIAIKWQLKILANNNFPLTRYNKKLNIDQMYVTFKRTTPDEKVQLITKQQ